jgi:hypothetical protein
MFEGERKRRLKSSYHQPELWNHQNHSSATVAVPGTAVAHVEKYSDILMFTSVVRWK